MNTTGDLSTLLRSWRERLTPQMVGLPATTSRRTSGLRREELAVLASVSVDYIVRLEQGRSAAPSPQVCATLAHALHLTETEQEHLFRLAGHAASVGNISQIVPASINRLIDRTSEFPMAVFDAMWNVLHWNALWEALNGEPDTSGERSPNLVWMHFAGDSDCHEYGPVSSESLDASLVADLRRSEGRYPDSLPLAALIKDLHDVSPRFRGYWARHQIDEHGPTVRRVLTSEMGTLELDYDIVTTQRHDLRLLTCTAEPGSESAGTLKRLARNATAHLPPAQA